MKRRLFLYGEIGCGKSTLIRTVLGAFVDSAGGFATRRIAKQDVVKGFTLFPAGELLKEEKTERCFLSFSEDLPEDKFVFTEYAPMLLYKAAEYPFVILDEIGGMELLESQFWMALQRFLESKVPCVGVLKTETAAKCLAQKTALGEVYEARYRALKQLLDADEDTEICPMSGWEDKAAEARLRNWAGIYTTYNMDKQEEV